MDEWMNLKNYLNQSEFTVKSSQVNPRQNGSGGCGRAVWLLGVKERQRYARDGSERFVPRRTKKYVFKSPDLLSNIICDKFYRKILTEPLSCERHFFGFCHGTNTSILLRYQPTPCQEILLFDQTYGIADDPWFWRRRGEQGNGGVSHEKSLARWRWRCQHTIGQGLFDKTTVQNALQGPGSAVSWKERNTIKQKMRSYGLNFSTSRAMQITSIHYHHLIQVKVLHDSAI